MHTFTSATCGGGGGPFYYPQKSPGPFHFQLFVHVCLTQCVASPLQVSKNLNGSDYDVALQEGYVRTQHRVFVLSNLSLLTPSWHLSLTPCHVRSFPRPTYPQSFQDFKHPHQSELSSKRQIITPTKSRVADLSETPQLRFRTDPVSTRGEECWKFVVPSKEMSRK